MSNESESAEEKFVRKSRAVSIWKNLNLRGELPGAVCLDMDSTLIKEESLGEFGRWLGKDISALTNATKDGKMDIRESLMRELDLMKPTVAQYRQFLTEFKPTLTDGADRLVNKLREIDVDVYLVTGGFVETAEMVAKRLGIPTGNIFANRFRFDADGSYLGIDETQLTSKSGSASVGKAAVCHLLREKHSYRVVVMIGDWVTDMEARQFQAADLFIGFGGNQILDKVRDGADWFVCEFDELTSEL